MVMMMVVVVVMVVMIIKALNVCVLENCSACEDSQGSFPIQNFIVHVSFILRM